MNGFGKYMQQQRAKDKRAIEPYFPKGFDIALLDVISEFNLSEGEIKQLGELTATKRSGLAHATIGHQVYYRRAQIQRLFRGEQTQVQ